MQVKPGRRRDELKFSCVDRKKHSDGVDLNTGLVRNHSFGHNGRASGRRLTISDEYCNARYVGTLALNNNRPYSSTDCSRYSYFIFTERNKLLNMPTERLNDTAFCSGTIECTAYVNSRRYKTLNRPICRITYYTVIVNDCSISITHINLLHESNALKTHE